MRPIVIALAATLLATAPLGAQRSAGVFFELGGPGGFGSLNLEATPVSHLHARAGAGWFVFPSVPAMLTCSIGSGTSSLELGVGATVIFFPSDPNHPGRHLLGYGPGVGTLVLGSAAIGYRYQALDGTLIRATLTPLYAHGDGALWVGISLGHMF